jgi:uncharacterized membrane protein YdjX (TVP38/TMEM64 family)
MTTSAAGRVHPQVWILAGVAVLVLLVPPVRHTLGHGLALLATGQLGQFQQFLRSLGAWAPAVSIALMTAEALLVPVPITIIMVANGLVFGLWPGMLVSLTGGLTGALAAYGVGRWLGRALVERLLPPASLAAADRLMAKYGSWAVVLERWIPGIPGDPMSYASGLTRLPALKFLALTTLGLVPANLVTAFVGTEVAGDIPLLYWIGGWAVAIGGWLSWRAVANARNARASTPPGAHP